MVFGANNVQVNSPSWLLGHFSIDDVIFGYNRVFVIGFAILIVIGTWLLLTKTPLGLLIRAVMQNRDMASCLGVRTQRGQYAHLCLWFRPGGLGGGVSFANRQCRPQPGTNLYCGQFHDCRRSAASAASSAPSAPRFGIGTADQVLQQTTGSPVTGKIVVLVAIILFLAMETGRLVCQPAAAAWTNRMRRASKARKMAWPSWPLVLLVVLPVSQRLHPAGSFLHVSNFSINLYGKYLCYAILAISVDLLWGYTGLLSLGQALFFTLGGYMMGMYLMRMIGSLGQYHQPIPDFLVFLGWEQSAGLLAAVFQLLSLRLIMAFLLPGPAGPCLVFSPSGRASGASISPSSPRRSPTRLVCCSSATVSAGRQQRFHRFQIHPRATICAPGHPARSYTWSRP